MPGLNFTRIVGNLPLYQSDQNNSELALSLYYFLMSEDDSQNSLPFAETWRDRSGAFIFLPTTAPITDPAAFSDALQKLLIPDTPQSQWIGWLPSPQPNNGALMDVRLISIAKQVGETRGRVVGDGAKLTFGNLQLVVALETEVQSETSDDAPAFTLMHNPTTGGLLTLEQIGTTRSLNLPQDEALTIALDRTVIGTWSFALRPDRGLFYTLFQAPDISGTPPSAEARFTFRQDNEDRQLRYPVLLGALRNPGDPAEQLPLNARIDPLHPTDDTRTRFAFDLAAYGGDGPALPVSQAFRTPSGRCVRLRPLEGAGFSLSRRVDNPAEPAPPVFLYLSPMGLYEATSVEDNPDAIGPIADNALLIMCGIYGTEFLLAAEEDRLLFRGDHPAFAPSFPGLSPGIGQPLLDGMFSSPWVTLIPGPRSDDTFLGFIKQSYCVQAVDAVYYQRENNLAIPFPVAVGARLADLSAPERAITYPMVPYGQVYARDPNENPNLDLPGTVIEAYETQILSRTRRQLIPVDRCLGPLFFNLATLDALEGGLVRTPQGLLVELNDGPLDSERPAGTWKRLLLARSPEKPNQLLQFLAATSPSGCEGSIGPFEVVSPLLSTTLMQNTPFLVITRPEPLGRFDNLIELGMFPYRIQVSGEDTGAELDDNTILIFKFQPDQPLMALATNAGNWTEPETFVGNPEQADRIAQQIAAYFQQAQALSEQAQASGAFDYFADFLARVNSPTWTGILALNVSLELSQLPIELQMLLGGLRSEQPLRGHHFGISTSQPRKPGAPADSADASPFDQSSLFGLVYYDEAFQTPPNTPYDFQTLRLNALYDNSNLKQFDAQIAYSLTELFDTPVNLVQGGQNDRLETNTIVIDGTLQERDGETSVVFATREVRVFDFPGDVDTRVISQMVAQNASLNPISRSGTDAVTVQSAFVLNGALGFHTRPSTSGPPIDLFSFAVDPGDPDTGLRYTAYEFGFETEIVGNRGDLRSINLNLSNLNVDTGNAVPREQSLIGTLPLRILGFRFDPDLTALGAKPVSGVGLDGGTPRFSFEFELVMGTLGALANSGPLEGTLLLGWQPGGSASQPDQVNMLFVPPEQLAGSDGFRLQGVFQTSYAQIRLERPTLTKPGQTKSIYVLSLSPIDFSIVGLPLIPPSTLRSLTFFGDPNSSPTDTNGTNLSWFLGQPLTVADLVKERPAETAVPDVQSAQLIFTPLAGILAGLKVDLDPVATLVIGPAISKLMSIPLATQDVLNDIFNGGSGGDVNYDPAAGVTAWFDLSFENLTFQAVLSDPYLYGGRIEIADDPGAEGVLAALGGLKLEIVYRRISDDLGVWSAFLTLPTQFRVIEFGKQAKLSLPSLGLAIFTNGDWRIDIGWPFIATTTFVGADQIILQLVIEGIPFKFAAGFYLAKLRSADNPAAYGTEFALIWQFGLGLSAGIAQEFPDDGKGPVKLSIEISVWTSFEGFLGSRSGAITKDGVDYYWFAGQLGFTANATGKVDFKVIKASLELEATRVFTLALETRHSTQLEFRVQFKINLSVKLVFVKISFRFTADIPVFPTVSIGSGPPALVSGPTVNAVGAAQVSPRLQRARKAIDTRLVQPLVNGRAAAQVDIALYLILQTTAIAPAASAANSVPQAVATLLIQVNPGSTEADPFSRLVQGVGNWLKERYGGDGPLTDQLTRIIEKIDDGTFTADLETCLSSAFRFRIQAGGPALADEVDPSAAIFPMFPWLALHYHGMEIPFNQPAVSDDYAQQLEAYFDQLATTSATGNTDLAMLTRAQIPQSITGIVFADFFDLLAKQLVRELQDLADLDLAMTFDEALAALGTEGYENIAGFASRYAQYGLRLPVPDVQPFGSQLEALYKLTRQQVALMASEGIYDTMFELAYANGENPENWIQFGADGSQASVTETFDPNLVLTQPIVPSWIEAGGAFEPLPPLERFVLRFFFGDIKTWTQADMQITQLRMLPEDLQRLLDAEETLQLAVELVADDTAGLPRPAGAETRQADTAPALFIPLMLEQIQGEDGQFLDNVYQLIGTDDATRQRMERLLNNRDALNNATLHMLASTQESSYRSSPRDTSIRLAKTNLSTLSEPPSLRARATYDAARADAPPNHARLADTEDFLALVWELSVVHTGGFFLYIDDLPDNAFSQGRAQIAVLATFGPPATEPVLTLHHNLLVLGEIPPADQAVAASIIDAPNQPREAHRSSLPAGSAGFRITWPQPLTDPTLDGNSTVEEKTAFLEALYNILQYRVESIDSPSGTTPPMALPSNWSLPIGATLPEDLPLDAAPGDTRWLFQQSLPIARFLGQENRFASVGVTAGFGVRLLDVYGNDLPNTYRVDATVVYHTPLMPVNEWPGMTTTYTVSPDTGDRALLQLVLRFEPSAAIPDNDGPDSRQQAIRNTLSDYRLIRDQIEDPNAHVQVETLLAARPIRTTTDSTELKTALADVVNGIIDYLDQLEGGGSPPVPQPRMLELALTPSEISRLPRDRFELTISLAIFRDNDRVDPSIKTRLPAVQRVASPLVPLIDLEMETNLAAADETEDTTLRAFAEAFERAYAGFNGSGSQLKLAEGEVASTALQTAVTRQLWAVRLGPDAGIEVHFPNAEPQPSAESLPLYLAPAPLSTQLLTRQETVRLYRDTSQGDGRDVIGDALRTFSDIDMDIWGRAFLLAVHNTLNPEMATAIATLDGERYTHLIALKEQLANAIQNDLQTILEIPGQGRDRSVAQERFRQALLSALPNDYSLSAVVQVPAEVGVQRTEEPPIPPQLYGDVGPSETEQNQAFSLSPAKLPTTPGRGSLPYLVSTKHPAAQAFLNLQPIYSVSFVEHEFRVDEARFGYVPSSWLSFIVPLFAPDGGTPALSLDTGRNDIPIPLRNFPPAPVIESQAASLASAPMTIDEALRWAYTVDVAEPQSAQDTLTLRIAFNEPLLPESPAEAPPLLRRTSDTADPDRDAPQDLFEALARFAFEFPQIQPHLEEIPAAAFQGRDPQVALTALARFEALVAGAAGTWQSWRNPALPSEQEQARRLRPAALAANSSLPQQTWQYVADFSQLPSLRVTRSIDGVANGLPPWPHIQGFVTPPEEGQASATYQPSEGDADKPDGRLVLTLNDLFLLTQQSARPTAFVERNANLVPDSAPSGTTVNPAFIYRTPNVDLDNPLVPLAEVNTPIDLSPAPSLSQAIDDFFMPFVDPANVPGGAMVLELRFGLDSVYRYRLTQGDDDQDDQVVVSTTPILLAQEEARTGSSPATEPLRTLDDIKRELVEALSAWFRAVTPSDQNAQISMGFTAFAGLSETPLPLSRFRALRIPVPENDPGWWDRGL